MSAVEPPQSNSAAGPFNVAGERALRRIERLKRFALAALPRMYLKERRRFCWCIRRRDGVDRPEGESLRYTAITLLGLSEVQRDTATDILGGESPGALLMARARQLGELGNLGDLALFAWAAEEIEPSAAGELRSALAARGDAYSAAPTVELAWAATALIAAADRLEGAAQTEALGRSVKLLLERFDQKGELFRHGSGRGSAAWMTGHVTCFADWVYPVQALSRWAKLKGDERAADVVGRCVRRMLGLQGDRGQWWWHYDARTGSVLERYPVYAVHQNGMAPMALLEWPGFDEAALAGLVRGVDWLFESPEMGDALLDEAAGLIWRKVARREPGKLVRSLQAGLSRVHPSLRVPQVDRYFPADRIDHECRPYHLGWILYAFGGTRRAGLMKHLSGETKKAAGRSPAAKEPSGAAV